MPDAARSAHSGPRELQHHFDSMEQQRDASALGMWVFLVTEILFFGGLFLACSTSTVKRPSPMIMCAACNPVIAK